MADPTTGQSVEVLIDGYKLANLVLTSSLSPGLIAPIPALIDNLANGDGNQAAARLAAGVPPPGVTGYGFLNQPADFDDGCVAALPAPSFTGP